MQFFVWGIDKPGMAATRAAIRNDHWGFIDPYEPALIARGPTLDLDDRDAKTGSIHILDVSDEPAAHAFAFDEPYARAGVFADIRLRRFRLELDRTQFQFDGPKDRPGFLFYCPAGPDRREGQAALAGAHRDYCQEFDAHTVCRGALLTDGGDWDGGIHLVEFANRDAAAAYFANEPYNRAGLYDGAIMMGWTRGGRR